MTLTTLWSRWPHLSLFLVMLLGGPAAWAQGGGWGSGPTVPSGTQVPPSSPDCVPSGSRTNITCFELRPITELSYVPWTCIDGSVVLRELWTTWVFEECRTTQTQFFTYTGSDEGAYCGTIVRELETYYRVKSINYTYGTPLCIGADGECCVVSESHSEDSVIGFEFVETVYVTTELCPDGQNERTKTTVVTESFEQVVTETTTYYTWICEVPDPDDGCTHIVVTSPVWLRLRSRSEQIYYSDCPEEEEIEEDSPGG